MMFVVYQQKLLASLRIREADPARILAVDCPANSALSRKLGVREREKVSEIVGRQPEDTKGHGVGPFLGENHFTPPLPTVATRFHKICGFGLYSHKRARSAQCQSVEGRMVRSPADRAHISATAARMSESGPIASILVFGYESALPPRTDIV